MNDELYCVRVWSTYPITRLVKETEFMVEPLAEEIMEMYDDLYDEELYMVSMVSKEYLEEGE